MTHQRKALDLLSAGALDCAEYERFLADNLCSMFISPQADSKFQVAASAYSHGDFTVARLTMEGRGEVHERSPTVVSNDGCARYALYIPLSGSMVVQQCGHEEQLRAGTAVFLSTSEPFNVRAVDATDLICFFLPQDFVDNRFADAASICGRLLNPRDGMSEFLIETVCALHTVSTKMNSAEFGRTARLVGDFVVLALGGVSTASASKSPVRSANLARAKRIIRNRCGELDLRLADIADECGLSLRYLHNLFTDEGCTFREYLMSERLKCAHILLKTSSPGTTRITDIGLASGFSNLSHFSAAFKKSFSCSPRDVLLGRA